MEYVYFKFYSFIAAMIFLKEHNDISGYLNTFLLVLLKSTMKSTLLKI